VKGGTSHDRIETKASQIEASRDDPPSLDWIAALASKASLSSASAAKRGVHVDAPTTTKEERIERRMVKKQRRQIEKDLLYEEMIRGRKQRAGEESAAAGVEMSKGRSTKATARKGNNRTKPVDQERLQRISLALQERLTEIDAAFGNHKRPSRPFQPPRAIKNTAFADIPAQFRKRKWEEASLQPRKRDYGGIGLARPTMYLDLADPSIVPKLEEEFHEHVPGFYGRSVFHNSQKRQASQTALWRTISDRAKSSGLKVDGKKLADMHPDERVEAMLRAGLI
jgi:hypothetical protein